MTKTDKHWCYIDNEIAELELCADERVRQITRVLRDMSDKVRKLENELADLDGYVERRFDTVEEGCRARS